MKSYHYYRRKRKRNREREKTNAYFANACVNLLGHIQKVAQYLNPAFHLERKVPHYEMLRKTITRSEEAEDCCLNVIEKELIIYKAFAEKKPNNLSEHQAILSSADHEFSLLQTEREENNYYPFTGMRLVTKEIVNYISTPEIEILIQINETLSGIDNEPLTQLFNHITIHINLLNPRNHARN